MVWGFVLLLFLGGEDEVEVDPRVIQKGKKQGEWQQQLALQLDQLGVGEEGIYSGQLLQVIGGERGEGEQGGE